MEKITNVFGRTSSTFWLTIRVYLYDNFSKAVLRMQHRDSGITDRPGITDRYSSHIACYVNVITVTLSMCYYCHKSALQLSIDANYRVYGGLSIVIYVHSDRGPFSGGPEDYFFYYDGGI